MSIFTTNVLGRLSSEFVLWDWEKVSKSLLDEVNILFMILDATCDNKALLWGDIVHDELLKKSSINVVNVLSESESWHTEGVVTICSSKKKLLNIREWVEFSQMFVEIVRFVVL